MNAKKLYKIFFKNLEINKIPFVLPLPNITKKLNKYRHST